MNLALYIYLCAVVGNIGGFFAALGFIVGIVLVIMIPASEGEIIEWKPYKFLWILVPFFIFISCLIPSQKTMYAMAAAYYGEQAVKSETFQRLNGKAMQLLEVKIDELLETKKEK